MVHGDTMGNNESSGCRFQKRCPRYIKNHVIWDALGISVCIRCQLPVEKRVDRRRDTAVKYFPITEKRNEGLLPMEQILSN